MDPCFFSDGSTATLLIKNMCSEDIAEYSCVAKNVRNKTHLELNAKESMLSKLPEVKAVSKGQDVKLTCRLNGAVDKVQWHKRGRFLVDEKSKCYGTKGRFIRDNLYNSAHTMESDYTQVWDMPSYQYLTRHYIKISNWILFSRKK